MRDPDQHIRDILDKFGEDFATETWTVPGGKARAIKHACTERIVAKAGIFFDKPEIISADPNNVVIIVYGTIPKENLQAWSFGEASPKNNKNAYVYAMAEKRAKGRVALKLLGLHGHLYDETEADDFKEARPRNGNGAEPKPEKSAYQARKDGDWQKFLEDLHAQDGTTAGLLKWVASRYPRIETFTWRGEAIEEWRQTLVHALAAECHSAVELERWRNEATATTDRLPLDWQLAASGALEDAIANLRVTA
jgi:hypothetical protein